MTPLLATSGLLTMLVIVVVVMGLMSLLQRPLKKQAAAQAEMRSHVTEGTRVMLASGLFGTVTHVGDEQMIVELAPGVEVTALKSAIAKVVEPSDEEFEFADSVVDDQAPAPVVDEVTVTSVQEVPAAEHGVPRAEN